MTLPNRTQIKAMDETSLLKTLGDIAALFATGDRLRFKGSQASRRFRAHVVIEAKVTVQEIEAELRSRDYVAKHGPYLTERMSPWAVEKRNEAIQEGYSTKGIDAPLFNKRFSKN